MLKRSDFSASWTGTRNATAPFRQGSSFRSSIVEGSGSGAPSCSIRRMCSASACGANRRASSNVLPAVMHPGKSGKLTPKSDLSSLCKYAMYCIVIHYCTHSTRIALARNTSELSATSLLVKGNEALRDDADAGLICRSERGLLVQQQAASGVEREAGRACLPHGFYGVQPNHWHVKAHVLV